VLRQDASNAAQAEALYEAAGESAFERAGVDLGSERKAATIVGVENGILDWGLWGHALIMAAKSD
jgi:hypothetical protein